MLNRRLVLGLTLALARPPALAQTSQTLRIGVTPGPHAQILEAVKRLAAARGLDIRIIEFSDYVVPNTALAAGELDANSSRTSPISTTRTPTAVSDRERRAHRELPARIYSKKHKSWDTVPNGAAIAIQNDPTNGGPLAPLLQTRA
jgi:D-methionine transport system substrate-binding protein